MEKRRVKAGLVGAGYAASFHYDALCRVYGVAVEIVGVYSRTKSRGQTFAEARNIRCFDTLDALIDAVDVVHVCATADVHEELTIAALKKDRFVIVEKPLTGYFGDGSDTFNGDTFPKQVALEFAAKSIRRMIEAEKRSKGQILYAENWVYAPSIQKEREIIEKTDAQVLWIYGEQCHSGSLAEGYGRWNCSGGGVMASKGCHPLSAALYLKQVEGMARNGRSIRPKSVTARAHAITRLPGFIDEGHIRCDYHDIDDFSIMHVVFEDGTVADIVASDIVSGGIKNHVSVTANNHRTICNIGPNNAMETYNPVAENFKDIYTVEKIGTKQGWQCTSPDEAWFNGYQHEMEAFYRTVAYGDKVASNSQLASDVILTIYSAYISAEGAGMEVDIPVCD
jgi:predicted dehydrogenase